MRKSRGWVPCEMSPGAEGLFATSLSASRGSLYYVKIQIAFTTWFMNNGEILDRNQILILLMKVFTCFSARLRVPQSCLEDTLFSKKSTIFSKKKKVVVRSFYFHTILKTKKHNVWTCQWWVRPNLIEHMPTDSIYHKKIVLNKTIDQ